jgi:hypothetical protein
MLLDSNILIYAAEPEGAFLSQWVEDAADRQIAIGIRHFSRIASGV